MNDQLLLTPIAHIFTDMTDKFGIPRQSGIVPELRGRLIFEPEFRDINAFKKIEEYSHLWLIWGFSANKERNNTFHATARPPMLGGNEHVGIFACRSPYRPNPLGLSLVGFESIENDPELGPILNVSGIDMLNGTPIYDIKPYLPYVESIPDASNGFARDTKTGELTVNCSPKLLTSIPEASRGTLLALLTNDPRPHYQNDPERIYKLSFQDFTVSFKVMDSILTVINISHGLYT